MDVMEYYLVEVVEPNPETLDLGDNSDDNIEISLHALSGSYNPQILWLISSINEQQLSIIIDGGSTHNFIQAFVVYKLGVSLQTLPEFCMFIGSDVHLIFREV